MSHLNRSINEVKEETIGVRREDNSRKEKHTWCVLGGLCDRKEVSKEECGKRCDQKDNWNPDHERLWSEDSGFRSVAEEESLANFEMMWCILHYGELSGALWIGCRGQGWVQGDQLSDLSKRVFGSHFRWVFWVYGTQVWGCWTLGLRLRVMLLFSRADFKLPNSPTSYTYFSWHSTAQWV